jgi:hypothetical protein
LRGRRGSKTEKKTAGACVLLFVLCSFVHFGAGAARVQLDKIEPQAQPATIVASQLRCESQDNPLGVQTEHPRFSWIPRATNVALRGVRHGISDPSRFFSRYAF